MYELNSHLTPPHTEPYQGQGQTYVNWLVLTFEILGCGKLDCIEIVYFFTTLTSFKFCNFNHVLSFFSRVFHIEKSCGNSLETFSEKFCSQKWFFSQVILKANWLSFQMRYSGGVYDIRKKCYSSFSGDTCPNSIVYNNVRTPILALGGQNELGKKF